MTEDLRTQNLETTTVEANTEQITLYQVMQKYFEVLAAVQKVLHLKPTTHHNQVIELESENELIELKPEQEVILDKTGSQPCCEKHQTYTTEQLAGKKHYLAGLMAKNLKMKAETLKKRIENHQKFIEAQSRFAKSQTMFQANQVKLSHRKQEQSSDILK
ncbi:hypothetical protein BZZ01_21460 [Nostocales cyanobacterium HT-58-2]|nr:hypothetical protein BZZ01_21460 [Nostocales cyanobacterium HT-58-2]